jgi:hypothetical protein
MPRDYNNAHRNTHGSQFNSSSSVPFSQDKTGQAIVGNQFDGSAQNYHAQSQESQFLNHSDNKSTSSLSHFPYQSANNRDSLTGQPFVNPQSQFDQPNPSPSISDCHARSSPRLPHKQTSSSSEPGLCQSNGGARIPLGSDPAPCQSNGGARIPPLSLPSLQSSSFSPHYFHLNCYYHKKKSLNL